MANGDAWTAGNDDSIPFPSFPSEDSQSNTTFEELYPLSYNNASSKSQSKSANMSPYDIADHRFRFADEVNPKTVPSSPKFDEGSKESFFDETINGGDYDPEFPTKITDKATLRALSNLGLPAESLFYSQKADTLFDAETIRKVDLVASKVRDEIKRVSEIREQPVSKTQNTSPRPEASEPHRKKKLIQQKLYDILIQKKNLQNLAKQAREEPAFLKPGEEKAREVPQPPKIIQSSPVIIIEKTKSEYDSLPNNVSPRHKSELIFKKRIEIKKEILSLEDERSEKHINDVKELKRRATTQLREKNEKDREKSLEFSIRQKEIFDLEKQKTVQTDENHFEKLRLSEKEKNLKAELARISDDVDNSPKRRVEELEKKEVNQRRECLNEKEKKRESILKQKVESQEKEMRKKALIDKLTAEDKARRRERLEKRKRILQEEKKLRPKKQTDGEEDQIE